MCLTLPEVLITVMGIEKLVPTWRDLEVFLQLLPRSSTAERMNPYTSMWTGVTPGDGPQAFHLILLDNGRTDVLSDATGRQALRCIRCSACLNVCPVYERTGGQAYGSVYPGPIGAILTPQLRGIARHPVDKQTASLPFASSLCGACFEVCPVRIDIPEVLVHLRGQVVRQSEATPSPPDARRRSRCGTAAWTFRSPRAARARRASGGPRRTAVRRGAAGCGGCPDPGRSGLVRRTRPQGAGARVVPSLVAAHRRRTGRGSMTDVDGPRDSGDARRIVLGRIRDALADRPAGVSDPARLRTCAAARDGSHRAVRRARERLPGDRPPDDGRRPAGGHRGRAGRARGDADRRPGRASPTRGSPDRARNASPTTRRCRIADLDALDGVVTGCAVAIAETGTIVLDAGPDQGRRALSLLPDLHVCVVDGDQVVGSGARGPRRGSTRPGPRPGSAGRRRRATSSSSASRASTARAVSRSSSSRTDRSRSAPSLRGLACHRPATRCAPTVDGAE